MVNRSRQTSVTASKKIEPDIRETAVNIVGILIQQAAAVQPFAAPVEMAAQAHHELRREPDAEEDVEREASHDRGLSDLTPSGARA